MSSSRPVRSFVSSLMFVSFVSALVACRADDRPAPPRRAPAPALAHGTQYDLGRELDDAAKLGTWTEVRHRWQGQRLRWSVTKQRSLCRTADSCNIAAFPILRPAPHGWMPKVELAPAQWQRLALACGDREQCAFTFEGTLRELDATGERATKLAFSDVQVL